MTLSRVADSLFWMSRYLERAENVSRVLDVHMNLTLDLASNMGEAKRVQRLLVSLSCQQDAATTNEALRLLTFDSNCPTAIVSLIGQARENARNVREQLSSEMWTQINKLYLQVRNTRESDVWETSLHDYYLAVRDGSHLFQGITDATMNHNQGWHFIQIGRYLERSIALLTLLDAHFEGVHLIVDHDITTARYFELIETLKSVSAFEAYTKVYSPNVQPSYVVEFLLFNEEFPRSLRFCIDQVLTSLNALAEMTGRNRNAHLYRLAGRLQSNLSFDEIQDVQSLHDYLEDVKRKLYRIHDTLYGMFIDYPIETAL